MDLTLECPRCGYDLSGAAERARQAKDPARAALEKQVRPITNFIQTYFKTTDADRATMGGSPALRAGSPTTAPLALVEWFA